MIVRFDKSYDKALDKIKDKTILKRIESTIQKAELTQRQIWSVLEALIKGMVINGKRIRVTGTDYNSFKVPANITIERT